MLSFKTLARTISLNYTQTQNDYSYSFPFAQLMVCGPVGPFGVIVLSTVEAGLQPGTELVKGRITEDYLVPQMIPSMKTPLAMHPPALVNQYPVNNLLTTVDSQLNLCCQFQ